ncbi:MAG: hypothetical protein AB7G47_13195 [Mycolicibacterium sp.]|uniref:hypothetical protein n=1 Tax=Mycolicibacterium sp. TaxID=2320850 RepID=UPI003D0ECEAF
MTTAHEKRVRRLAAREGYRLRKLRDDDGYFLLDTDNCGLVLGEQITAGVNIGCSLDYVQDWLTA